MLNNEEKKEFLNSMIGQGSGYRTMEYSWRDVILYALGVGAHMEDLPYVYEKGGLKVLPSFGVLPYLNSIMISPRVNNPVNPFSLVKERIIREEGHNVSGLHMAMNMEIYKTIDPMQGTLLVNDRVEKIYDRGEGKGIVVTAGMDVYNLAGEKICKLTSDHLAKAWGGYGGEPQPSVKVEFPDREPDAVMQDHLQETQALLYRMLGDVNDVHVDVNLAQSLGYEKPFMMGMCTYGYACRMAIQALFPYETERVTRIYGQLRSLCFPGEDVTLHLWKVDEHKAVFRLLNASGKAVLDKGILEFK